MIIIQYKNYYETNEEKDKLETLKKIDMIVKILTLIMLLIGYSKYVVSYNYNNLELFNFLFIKNKCYLNFISTSTTCCSSLFKTIRLFSRFTLTIGCVAPFSKSCLIIHNCCYWHCIKSIEWIIFFIQIV